jgi:hypothetical protein
VSKFAVTTEVSVEKSRAEIEATVSRYGASGFMSGWVEGRAMIGFEMNNRQVRFILPLPDRNAQVFTHSRHNSGKMIPRSPEATFKAWEQACRQRWRALLLAIKAKLEAVECGISVFDDEFLAFIVMPGGKTIGEQIAPQIGQMLATGNLPRLLPAPGGDQ